MTTRQEATSIPIDLADSLKSRRIRFRATLSLTHRLGTRMPPTPADSRETGFTDNHGVPAGPLPSDREAFAALLASSGKHIAPVLGFHPFAKTVFALALDVRFAAKMVFHRFVLQVFGRPRPKRGNSSTNLLLCQRVAAKENNAAQARAVLWRRWPPPRRQRAPQLRAFAPLYTPGLLDYNLVLGEISTELSTWLWITRIAYHHCFQYVIYF